MLDVHRLQRMLALAVAAPAPTVPAAAAAGPAPARFLRPATQDRLTLVPPAPRAEGDSA